MNPNLLIECEYRNHNKLWLAVGFIESVAVAKNGSVIRMISGTAHDVLDTPESIAKAAVRASANAPA